MPDGKGEPALFPMRLNGVACHVCTRPSLHWSCTTQCTCLFEPRVTWSGCQLHLSLASQSHSASKCWAPNNDAGMPCLLVASLTGTWGASTSRCSKIYLGAPSMPTEVTPPGCFDVAACSGSHRCPSRTRLPVPLRCHLWVVVGHIIAGAYSCATVVRASGAVCAILEYPLPPVQLPSLAHAAAPPGLLVALSCNDDAAQVGVGRMVPLLLQVQSRSAYMGPAWCSE